MCIVYSIFPFNCAISEPKFALKVLDIFYVLIIKGLPRLIAKGAKLSRERYKEGSWIDESCIRIACSECRANDELNTQSTKIHFHESKTYFIEARKVLCNTRTVFRIILYMWLHSQPISFLPIWPQYLNISWPLITSCMATLVNNISIWKSTSEGGIEKKKLIN